MTRRSARGLITLAALSLSLALFGSACADQGEELTTTGSPGGRSGDPLFVSIEVGGGFVPQGHDFRQAPTAVIYSDGQAFTPGAITLQYPGAAVLPVIEAQLTESQVDEVLQAAEKAELTGESRDYGQPPIADAPTTTITVVIDGQTHVARIEALQEASGDFGESAQPPPGMSEEAIEARRKAREFVDFVGSLLGPAGGDEYEPERYRVLPLAVPSNEPSPAGDPAAEPQPQVRDWPFPEIELVENECLAVKGADAASFREVLRESNEITRWQTSDGRLFTLAIRPVLPHEPDCPEPPDSESP